MAGLKGSVKLLNFYVLLTALAVGLSLVPMASGQYTGKARRYAKLSVSCQCLYEDSLAFHYFGNSELSCG